MPTNVMNFNQVSTILAEITQQATGQAVIAPINTADFVTVATTALNTGFDPLMNAINQVLSRTIFSVRPYYAKFKGLERSEAAYGNHVRKLSIADRPAVDDDGFKFPVGYDAAQENALGNGQSVDQYVLRKPDILQTNFYGASTFADYFTIFEEQLNSAFTGPDQLASFIGMVMQNASDKQETWNENTSRAILANYIGGILDEAQNTRVVHLLSEYNTLTGQQLSAQQVYQPANFKAFMQWVYSRIADITAKMTERSQLYQTVINGKPVLRHTPYRNQKVYLYAPARFQTEAQVLADTYHDNYLRLADVETVNFWQSIETPDSISVTPSRIGTNGSVVTAASEIEQAGIFGVIFDEEAIGYARVNMRSIPTPLNARGRYTNYWMHTTFKAWNDHTEKGVVLLLD